MICINVLRRYKIYYNWGFICLLVKFLLIVILSLFLSVLAVGASEIDNVTIDNVTIEDSGIQDDFNNQNEHYLEYENDISEYSLCNFKVSSSYIESSNTLQLGGVGTFTDLDAIIQLGGEVTLVSDYTFNPTTDTFIHNGMGIALVSPTVIEGNGHTINANFKTIIFRLNAADFTFRNVVFMNAVSQFKDCRDNIIDGGAIRLMNSRLTLYNCTFITNRAYGGGGAIYVGANSPLETSLCNFTHNAASKGGAIFADNNTQIIVSSSSFSHNTAQENNVGGAICCDDILSQRCTYSNNHAARGGAVQATQGIFKYVNFYNNNANAKGGAFYSDSNEKMSVFNNVYCRGNSAESGGAISVQNESVVDSSFKNNFADEFGGAIDAWLIGIERCLFEDNNAEKRDGGAVRVTTFKDYKYNTHQYDLLNCKFINNHAGRDGGAIFTIATYENERDGGRKLIANNYFDGNSAGRGSHHLHVQTHLVEEVKIQYNVFVNSPSGQTSVITVPLGSDILNNWWGRNNPNWRTNTVIKRGSFLTQDLNNVIVRVDAPQVMETGDFPTFRVNFLDSLGNALGSNLYGIDVEFTSTTGIFNAKMVGNNYASASYVHEGRSRANAQIIVNNERINRNIVVNGMGAWVNIIDASGKYVLGALALGGIAAIGYIFHVIGGDDGDGTADNPAGTIQSAVDAAHDGDIIFISPGTYSGKGNVNVNINKNLTIVSLDYGDVVIDGEGQSRIFNVSANNFNVYGLVFKNSKGSAITFNKELYNSVINATFINNSADYGSAIKFNELSKNNTIQGIFLNNTANTGSVIYMYNSEDI